MDEGAITLAEDLPLGEDLPCMRCHYNLRTLAPSAKCPECGAGVRESVEHSHRMAGLNLRVARRGIAMLSVYALATAGFGACYPFLYERDIVSPRFHPAVLECINLLVQGMLFAGILLLRKSLPSKSPGKIVGSLCLASVVYSLCVSTAWNVYGFAMVANRSVEGTLGVLSILDSLGQLGLDAAALALVLHLARCLGKRWLGGISVTFFILDGITAIWGAAINLTEAYLSWRSIVAFPHWVADGMNAFVQRSYDTLESNQTVGWIWMLLVAAFWMVVWRKTPQPRDGNPGLPAPPQSDAPAPPQV